MSNHWLANDFDPFVLNANATNLPIDPHELVAMIAPRSLLVLDTPRQRQLSAPSRPYNRPCRDGGLCRAGRTFTPCRTSPTSDIARTPENDLTTDGGD
ncbi:glucuronyl esterase domain-containing protein [Sorangium sp. So ce367]|uniref:glucuronyl esterase domain-containing protein n=1 Tax=Sorangium sp. So ce367 TaxID=3133305 RepID=UPI003F5D664B